MIHLKKVAVFLFYGYIMIKFKWLDSDEYVTWNNCENSNLYW